MSALPKPGDRVALNRAIGGCPKGHQGVVLDTPASQLNGFQFAARMDYPAMFGTMCLNADEVDPVGSAVTP